MFEPRLGMSYRLNEQTILRASAGVFHNRVTLNDSTLLGGKPPFQPMVTVANGLAGHSRRQRRRGDDLPFGRRRRIRCSSTRRPTCGRSACSGSCRSGSSSTRPTSDAAASICSGSATSTSWRPGTVQAQPWRQHRGAAALQGLRGHPALGERRQLQAPQPAADRRSALPELVQGRRRLHA